MVHLFFSNVKRISFDLNIRAYSPEEFAEEQMKKNNRIRDRKSLQENCPRGGKITKERR